LAFWKFIEVNKRPQKMSGNSPKDRTSLGSTVTNLAGHSQPGGIIWKHAASGVLCALASLFAVIGLSSKGWVVVSNNGVDVTIGLASGLPIVMMWGSFPINSTSYPANYSSSTGAAAPTLAPPTSAPTTAPTVPTSATNSVLITTAANPVFQPYAAKPNGTASIGYQQVLDVTTTYTFKRVGRVGLGFGLLGLILIFGTLVISFCKARGKEYDATYFGIIATSAMAALAFYIGAILYGLSIPTIGPNQRLGYSLALYVLAAIFSTFASCLAV